MIKTYGETHQPNRVQFLILALFIVLIGSSTAAYGQFSTSFEGDAPNFGDFTLFSSPNSVTFTGGFTQTQNQPGLYKSGAKSFMVNLGIGNTATITFETPAASVTLWLRDQSNTSVLKVFDQNSQLISTINATTSFVQVNMSPECGKFVSSITLQNNGTGMAVIDDFSFTAGQVPPSQNTVLIASFLNGNTDFFRSRVYLFNPSASAGIVCGRLFTLPRTDGLAQELTNTPLDLGTLAARSALNLRLEDILAELLPLGPYVTDNGNLILELTIGSADVKGAAQVFNNSLTLAFGTYPLQAVPSTSAGSPTVLVANFLNGNTDFFRSRIYLFNPSVSDGPVTVRVYTLPRTDGQAEELTTSPHPLGTLAARSALNIRLEDILDDLLPPGPYVTDNGNLILEFTIGAADVIGAAQVFNNSLTLAFGTYPLQMIP